MNERAHKLLEEAALILKGDVKNVTTFDSQKKLNKVVTITYPYEEFPESIQFVEKDSTNYVFGGMEVHSTNILRLISELEGSYQMCKYMAFEDDMNTLEEMKKRYYKMYFKLAKQEKSMLD